MERSGKYYHITAAILAGGKSTRMQTDKALLKLNDITFLESIVNTLCKIFDKVIIISDHRERYDHLNLPIYPDVYKESGPLAGIHSAFLNTNTESIFIATCDNPFISPDAIRYLVEINSSNGATVYSFNDKSQPLFGVYRRTSLPLLIQQLESKQLSALDFLKKVNTKFINAKSLPFDGGYIFININTPEDYKMMKEKYDYR